VHKLLIANGLSYLAPEHFDKWYVLLQLDPLQEMPWNKVVRYLSGFGYETDRALDVAETDAWVERHLVGSTLTVDLVTYPDIIEGADVDPDTFNQPSVRDPSARVVLRVSAEVDCTQYSQVEEHGTFLWWASEDIQLDQIKQEIADEVEWPLVFGRLRGVSANINVQEPTSD
jgi:hypothetical protein